MCVVLGFRLYSCYFKEWNRFGCQISEMVVFISPHVCTESGENVADSAPVPPSGLSCISCAPDPSFISPGRRSPQQSTLSQAVAVPEPEELTGRAGTHSSSGIAVGGELLPHRWSEIFDVSSMCLWQIWSPQLFSRSKKCLLNLVTARCYITGVLFDKKSGWKVDLRIHCENGSKQ